MFVSFKHKLKQGFGFLQREIVLILLQSSEIQPLESCMAGLSQGNPKVR